MGNDRDENRNLNIKALEADVKELHNTVTDLKQRLEARYAAPVLQCQEELGLYEAIFDILASPRADGKPIVTQEEIRQYFDQYKQIWTVMVNILIDKGITTPKELNCSILAFHHFFRIYGFYNGKTPNELFAARQAYIKELMALPDPTMMIGH
jgi:tRNA nucleotidyltransferase/poly(A) polymerase